MVTIGRTHRIAIYQIDLAQSIHGGARLKALRAAHAPELFHRGFDRDQFARVEIDLIKQ
jgi:hypothetical protein